MHRRQILAAGGALAFGGIAGCIGDTGSGTPANEYDYETTSHEGTEVPLAPIDDVIGWYEDESARFADARGRDQYDEVRVMGAVHSPATYDLEDDPVDEWSTDTQIVTYCGCPHHLSVMRASQLIDDGYEHTYALDEGLQEWYDRGYPMEGSAIQVGRQAYDISGRTESEYAGEMVVLEQLDAERYEAAPVDGDGSYALTLHYSGSPDSPFRLEAPDYVVEGSLAELASAEVSADMAV